MPDPMRIDLESTGLAQAAKALGGVAAHYQKIANAQRQVSRSLPKVPAGLTAANLSTGKIAAATAATDALSGAVAQSVRQQRRANDARAFGAGVLSELATATRSTAAAQGELNRAYARRAAGDKRQSDTASGPGKLTAATDALTASLQANLATQRELNAARQEGVGVLVALAKATREVASVNKAAATATRAPRPTALPKLPASPGAAAQQAQPHGPQGPKQQVQPKKRPVVAGPHQAARKAQDALAAAATPEERADAQIALRIAQERIDRASRNAAAKTQRLPKPALVGGPHQALAKAQKALGDARTPDQAADAQLALSRAQRQLQALQPKATPALGQRLMQAVFSSRFNLPGMGKVQPLIGRSLDVLFPGWHKSVFGGKGGGGSSALASAAVGRLAAGLIAGAVAVKGLADAASAAAKVLDGIRADATLSGGTSGNTAKLRAAGLKPGEIASTAAALRERLGSDPYAMAAGAKVGLGYTPGRPYGPANEAGTLEKATEGLRAFYERAQQAGTQVERQRILEEQLRAARALGLDGMLDTINVSREQWIAMMRTANLQRALASPKYLQASRDLSAAQRRISMGWDNLSMATGRLLIPALVRVTNRAADVLDGLARALDKLSGPIERFQKEHPVASAGLGTAATDIALGYGGYKAAQLGGKGLKWALDKIAGRTAAAAAASAATKTAAPAAAKAATQAIGKTIAVKAGGRTAAALAANAIPGIGKVISIGLLLWTAWDIYSAVRNARREGGPEGVRGNPLDRNTKALEGLSGMMERGLRGGGQRAQGAIPPGFSGPYLEKMGGYRARACGAFGV